MTSRDAHVSRQSRHIARPAANPEPRGTVALFVTCLTDTFFPRAGEAVVRVLRHLGCQVEFPLAQTCCGQPAYTTGMHDDARALGRRWIEIFRPYEWVVSPSASCAGMVQKHLPELLADDPVAHQAAKALAARTYEFSAFLVRRQGFDIAAALRLRQPATFHWPCHARGQFSAQELAVWLGCDAALPSSAVSSGPPPPSASRPATTIVPTRRPDLCCGFGGAFAVDYPEISGPMLSDKLTDLAATGARDVICSEGGCGLHMLGGAHRQGLPLRFKHLAEHLAESLGLMESAP